MRTSLVCLSFLCLLNCAFPQSGTDTLRIQKDSSGTFSLAYFPDSDQTDYPELVVINEQGNIINRLGIWPFAFDSALQQLRIPLHPSATLLNRDFYLANFPSIQSQIDTSQYYSIIQLGQIIGTVREKGEMSYKVVMNDENYLWQVDSREIRNQFEDLKRSRKYAEWNCEDHENAYLLFLQISWLALVENIFTNTEYRQLDDLLVPCLGAELGEGFIEVMLLLRFIK